MIRQSNRRGSGVQAPWTWPSGPVRQSGCREERESGEECGIARLTVPGVGIICNGPRVGGKAGAAMGICLNQPGIRPSLTRRAISVIPVQKTWGLSEAVRQTSVDDSRVAIVHQPVSVASRLRRATLNSPFPTLVPQLPALPRSPDQCGSGPRGRTRSGQDRGCAGGARTPCAAWIVTAGRGRPAASRVPARRMVYS